MLRLLSILLPLLLSAAWVSAKDAPCNDTVTSPAACGTAETSSADSTVYVIPLHEEIMPAAVRRIARSLGEAERMGASCIIIDMNTYGGLLDAADSIRTMFLRCSIPTMTFVNNQAASAGALIAIATDSIYMRPEASMGAATVVDQNGEPMPAKYQSFMRAIMRATAESHGRDRTGNWRRNPLVAEAMVDPAVEVPGLSGPDDVVTLTADEALRWGYSEGTATGIEEVLDAAGLEGYHIHTYSPTPLDRVMGFLSNPVLQAICVIMMISGIYFELQSPGVGLPLAVALLGAALYFAPLYIEGLAANWEILLFVAGIALLLIEILAIPGFGITGIAGIAAATAGLVLALIDRGVPRHVLDGALPVATIMAPLLLVVISAGTGTILSLWLGSHFLRTDRHFGGRIVLGAEMGASDGYVSVPSHRGMVGRRGRTVTPLRPAGKVEVEGRRYEAAGDDAAFIEAGRDVEIIRDENGILYCRELPPITTDTTDNRHNR